MRRRSYIQLARSSEYRASDLLALWFPVLWWMQHLAPRSKPDLRIVGRG
jgi:hypothetical protein